MYCHDDDSETEIDYSCTKTVDTKSNFKEELNILKKRLVEFINKEIDQTKEIVNSPEIKDKLEKSIEKSLAKSKELGNKNARHLF